VPLVMFQEAGITPGEQVQTGGHNQSVQAVYDGEVDFATTFFSWPTAVDTGDSIEDKAHPDIPDDLVDSCGLNADGNLVCGNYRVRDARANIREGAPDVVQKVKILMISGDIPNDTLSFSPTSQLMCASDRNGLDGSDDRKESITRTSTMVRSCASH
jgi:phosphonate transport system substrate-binding protein